MGGAAARARLVVGEGDPLSLSLSLSHTQRPLSYTHINSLILETDPATVAARVSMAGAEGGELPLGEQTLARVAAMAKEQIARSLLK